MRINRWLSGLLLFFTIIEILGGLFWHSADEVCPTCHGTGKVWVPGNPRFGFFGYWAVCPECGGTGFVWRCSAPTAVALYSILFTFIFFSIFFLTYACDSFYADVNPWVNTVKKMEWFFNPMYWAWLLRVDKRRWALYRTIISSLLTLLFGEIIFYIFTYGKITLQNSLIGFSIGCIFLIYLSLSWYKGFWKPRTRETPTYVPESVEAEWRDKEL